VQERISPLIDAQITFAHRGARAHLQENTIAAFELALRLGATGLESDTWITRDGVAVLDHDGIVKSRLRSKSISDFNRTELPDWIPSLADLYQRCGTDAHLSLDIKDVNSMDDVVHTMFTRGNPNKTWLCHVNMPFPDWNGGLVALFHRFDIYCFGWNLQYPEVLTTGLRMGLDGIFSDWPDRASDALRTLNA